MAPITGASKHSPVNTNAIEDMQALVGGHMANVNKTILDKMQSPVALIPQLAGHLIASGGKRLRPMLTLACSEMLGLDMARPVRLAACVEFIHTATLLHDDVVDDSNLRRGQDTANAVWGNQASVLVGDFLFSRAFELMVEDGSLEVLRILSGASSIIAEGEVLQLTTAGDLSTDRNKYLDVISAKTAALFGAACEIAPVMAGADRDTQQHFKDYGDALGIAFQIVDDILDYRADQAQLGKTVGDDFREGKVTLPVILAYEAATVSERKFWERVIEQGEQKSSDLEEALDLMTKYDTLDRSAMEAKSWGQKAQSALDHSPDSPAKSALIKIIDFSLERLF